MQIFVTNRAFNMFKIELENHDFRKSLYFYIVDAGKKRKKKKKRAASGCWHYIKLRANIKWTLVKIWAAGACQRPDMRAVWNISM